MNQLAGPSGSWWARIKQHKKWLIIGVIVSLILGMAASTKFKAIEAEKVRVEVSDVTSTVVEKGTVIRDQASVFSEAQGKVKNVFVDEGQTVQKGQVLAEIDIGDIDSQIAQIEGQLRAVEGSKQAAGSQTGQNQIKNQQLAVEQAEIALSLAQTAYQRMQKLFSEGAVTQADLDQAKADLETREKTLEQANFSLRSIQGQNQGSQVQFQGQRESLLAQQSQLQTEKAKARIIAEDGNIILTKKIKAGDYVTPGTMLFTMGRQGNLKIESYVSSSDTAYLKIGDEVSVSFKLPGQDANSTGKISKIAPIAEPVVSALGISEPKIKITVDLNTLPTGFKVVPGADVDVTFITQRHPDVLAIPKEALFSDNGKVYVWTVTEGTASLKQIEKGAEGDDLTVILEGLNKGDLILLNPHQQDLQPGMRIK
ncbi:MAG: HlyD family efflux transporter periplasmic adaptor subunit [Thermincola sp.]|nr:HlyD family efflux transporter periplasmic adaptor subunit [Thermincola sp.]MDT3702725.1 HlyD family efflux transporter periplasmic adaptor subunit [Thermincola sp.]